MKLFPAIAILSLIFSSALFLSCDIEASENSVAALSLNCGAASLLPGDSLQLQATVLPESALNKSLSWESSAPGIATVSSSGLVQALTQGSASISARSTDGGKVAACAITVLAELGAGTVRVTGLSLADEFVSIDIDEDYTLNTTLLPADASLKTINWMSTDSTIATVSQAGVVSGLSRGFTSIGTVKDHPLHFSRIILYTF